MGKSEQSETNNLDKYYQRKFKDRVTNQSWQVDIVDKMKGELTLVQEGNMHPIKRITLTPGELGEKFEAIYEEMA